MLIAAVATLRRILIGAWVLVLLGLIGLAVFTRLNPTFVIRGGSMQPAVPLGSLVVLEPVAGHEIRVGDVITIRADNGVAVTHRVTRTADLSDGRFLQTQGDANPTPDPNLVPIRGVEGRVTTVVPMLGYLAAMMGTASGLISLLSLLAAGMLGIWLIDEREAEMIEERVRRERVARERAAQLANTTAGAAAGDRSPDGAIA